MRILLVSQLYPGPEDPDLGVFVRDLETQLVARGHVVERAVLNRRSGGKRRYVELARTTATRARMFKPDVVYAHFLVPTGLVAALAARAPLVVTAHGRDVRNVGAYPGVRAATQYVVRRAARVIAVSDYLRRELEAKVPDARGKTIVIPSGVDLDRFTPSPAPEPPSFLCIGSLTPRKNVLRLARAFETLGDGTLTFVGDGPLRAELGGRMSRSSASSLTRSCRLGSGPRASSVNRVSSSRSGRRSSKRWRPAERSSRRGSAVRRSSCRPTRAYWSIPSTKERSRTRCGRRRPFLPRTPPDAPPPSGSTSGVRPSASRGFS